MIITFGLVVIQQLVLEARLQVRFLVGQLFIERLLHVTQLSCGVSQVGQLTIEEFDSY